MILVSRDPGFQIDKRSMKFSILNWLKKIFEFVFFSLKLVGLMWKKKPKKNSTLKNMSVHSNWLIIKWKTIFLVGSLIERLRLVRQCMKMKDFFQLNETIIKSLKWAINTKNSVIFLIYKCQNSIRINETKLWKKSNNITYLFHKHRKFVGDFQMSRIRTFAKNMLGILFS